MCNSKQNYVNMKKEIIVALIVAIGLVGAGCLVQLGLKRIADKDRFVTVKGLSEREGKADHVTWPMHFSVSGNDLRQLTADCAAYTERVKEFMQSKGFKAEDMQAGSVSFNNNWSQYYSTQRPEYHYTLSSSLVLTTTDVDKVVANQNCLNELLEKGMVVESGWINYQYKAFTDLKPEMIAEATKNARAVAQKFADDAACRLGSIRQANQGQFSMDNDSDQPWIIKVRVVSTFQYYLK